MRSGRIAAAVAGVAAVAFAVWLLPQGHETPPYVFAMPRAKVLWPLDPSSPEQARRRTLHQARVMTDRGATPADLATNPPDPGGTLSGDPVRCRYLDGAARGTTAKFDCVLRDGEVVKVKYGGTGEIQAEVAATRLLTALGFGADRMYLVPRLRCYGCLRTPFYTNWVLDKVRARQRVASAIGADAYTDFEWTAVERHFDAIPIEAGAHQGWAWFELEPMDASLGANRAERDALNLMAMLLAHWDNKASNQRLVCVAASVPPDAAPCPLPFAIVNDLGATFGPNKMDLESWRASPIWVDRARCTVSMKAFPYSGSTFPDTGISEEGRQLIARMLTSLSDDQVMSLFAGARFPGDIRRWTAAFRDKVRQIAEGAPCPL